MNGQKERGLYRYAGVVFWLGGRITCWVLILQVGRSKTLWLNDVNDGRVLGSVACIIALSRNRCGQTLCQHRLGGYHVIGIRFNGG